MLCPALVNKPVTPPRMYRQLRDQFGSMRRVYMPGNRIVRRGDFAQFDQTVLLLHGFFQTRNVWQIMEDRLRHDGYGCMSFDLGGFLWAFNSRPIPVLAQMVADKIEGICARYGVERFHIIGHSKGGLIARTYVQHFGGDRRVKSVVTLGTPHHGTPTAALAVGVMGGKLLSRSPLDMLPGSPFVRWLQRDHFPAGVPLVSVYSRHDVVCPWWCSVLRPRPGETSMQNLQVRGVGHTALTHDPGVYHLVRTSLDQASQLWRERSGADDPSDR